MWINSAGCRSGRCLGSYHWPRTEAPHSSVLNCEIKSSWPAQLTPSLYPASFSAAAVRPRPAGRGGSTVPLVFSTLNQPCCPWLILPGAKSYFSFMAHHRLAPIMHELHTTEEKMVMWLTQDHTWGTRSLSKRLFLYPKTSLRFTSGVTFSWKPLLTHTKCIHPFIHPSIHPSVHLLAREIFTEQIFTNIDREAGTLSLGQLLEIQTKLKKKKRKEKSRGVYILLA